MSTPFISRADALRPLLGQPFFDVVVIGGGATGLGIAVDAALQGRRVLLLEARDYAKGTSSRATKLVHGGVRYLAQGNLSLVREALHERTVLLRNAPHLAQPLSFVMPAYRWWEKAFYGLGLKAYDVLAGRASLGPTRLMDAAQVRARLTHVQPRGLWGGVQYWDGQFDDARLAVALARTAQSLGAVVLNHCPVEALLHEDGRLVGLRCSDAETGQTYTVRASCIINATGVWVDEVRAMDARATGRPVKPMVTPSQGVHLVVDRAFWPSDDALLIPHTADGRVLFAVPWLGKVILGTTDTPRPDHPLEPQAQEEEVAFILREAARYLVRAPERADVRSIWAGLRPLVRPGGEGRDTRSISREHTIWVDASGLVSVTGGKWTTYRAMAEDVLRHCETAGLLAPRSGQRSTAQWPLWACPQPGAPAHSLREAPGLHLYGAEADVVRQLPGADHVLGGGLSEAMVRFAVRYEQARTVEDVLARRSRLLFLDARLARSLAPQVAQWLIEEGAARPQLTEFMQMSDMYILKEF